MYAPPRPPRTPLGVKWSYVAFLLSLGSLVGSLLVAIVAFQVLASLSPTNVDQTIAALIGLLVAGVLVIILVILVLVFYFLGFGYLYGGRNEFRPSHPRNLRLPPHP